MQDEIQDVKMASAYLKFSVILQLLLCPGKVLTQLRCGGKIFFDRLVSHFHVLIRRVHVLHFHSTHPTP